MTVWAIATVRDEADIIAATVGHLISEGVEHFLIVDHDSTDETRSILEQFPQVEISEDHEPFHHHAERMTALAETAGSRGASWIIPFDADEFWCPTGDLSLVETLETQPELVAKLPAVMYQHINREHREPSPKPLPKMAFRYQPECTVHYGNHDVDGVEGSTIHGLIQVREIQYRSAEHFAAKIVARLATIAPGSSDSTCAHIRQYAGWTREQLDAEYERFVAKATLIDPIPTR